MTGLKQYRSLSVYFVSGLHRKCKLCLDLDLSSDLAQKNQFAHHRSLDKSFAKTLPSIPDLMFIPTCNQNRTYSHVSPLIIGVLM